PSKSARKTLEFEPEPPPEPFPFPEPPPLLEVFPPFKAGSNGSTSPQDVKNKIVKNVTNKLNCFMLFQIKFFKNKLFYFFGTLNNKIIPTTKNIIKHKIAFCAFPVISVI